MKRFFLFLLLCSPVSAATYTAAGCSPAQWQAAITAEQATPADGDIIQIPACAPTSWTSTLTPATFTTNVTIQGAGAISSTDGGAAQTGSDLTSVVDNIVASGVTMISFNTSAGKTIRVTGIAFIHGTAPSPVLITISGVWTSQVRFDHNHVEINSQRGSVFGTGPIIGVADHNFYHTGTNGTPGTNHLTNDMGVFNGDDWNGSVGSSPNADSSWTTPDNFGTNQFMFFEDNRMENGDVGDAHDGGRYVLRRNTFVDLADGGSSCSNGIAANQMFNHGVTTRARATRATEVYQNSFISPLAGSPCFAGAGNAAYAINSGVTMFWGNTVTNYRNAVGIGQNRTTNTLNGSYQPPPNGWGVCGTNFNGVNSAWDENTPPTTGYACLDAPGRGAGDLLAGANFPTVCNITLNPACNIFTGQWPRQALDPFYIWNNTYTPSPGYSGTGVVNGPPQGMAQDVDYYVQFGTATPWSGFTGASGIGQGVIASRPATCTKGVGYWATDVANSNQSGGPLANGVFYICTATNTWTLSYQPYTYPHPLTGGAATPCAAPSISPASEVFFNTFNATITAVCTSIIYTIDGTTPTASGVCAAVNGTLYSGPVSISATTTLSAIACQATFTTSGTATANYTLSTPAPSVQMLMGSLLLEPQEGRE